MGLPKTMFAWQLYGAGFENFGCGNQPAELAVPTPKPDELLVKINAIGLCFSDVKLIRAGEEHPRVRVENLKKDPVVPGHEAVMTIVEVGSNLKDQYKPGQRFIIQADIYVKGVGWAYGYAINGGMEQYSILDQRVLNGDEGCYLLPLADSTPSAVAALFEPWTCVLASYTIQHRSKPLDGGRMAFFFGCDCFSPELGALVSASKPAEIAISGKIPVGFQDKITKAFPAAKIVPAEGKFDDIFLCNTLEGIASYGAFAQTNACISIIRGGKAPEFGNKPVDVGSIHYQGWFYQGTNGGTLSDAYGRNVRSPLRKGGTCWLSGGAGAMGQMHTQLAVMDPNGPAKILVSDMDDTRLANVESRLRPFAEKRGAEFKLVNPSKMTPEEFNKLLKEFAPDGFDDIVMLVPVPAVLTQAASWLGKDGLMNIFAGIPAGKEAALPLDAIIEKGVRYVGSSGSRTADLRHTVEMVEAGKIDPVTALAAIGGMKQLKNGLDAVANAKFPGKTVIYPNCPDMPLVPVSRISELGPEIAATLKDGAFTLETEKAILKKYGC